MSAKSKIYQKIVFKEAKILIMKANKIIDNPKILDRIKISHSTCLTNVLISKNKSNHFKTWINRKENYQIL